MHRQFLGEHICPLIQAKTLNTFLCICPNTTHPCHRFLCTCTHIFLEDEIKIPVLPFFTYDPFLIHSKDPWKHVEVSSVFLSHSECNLFAYSSFTNAFASSVLQLLHFKYCTQQNCSQNLLNKEVTFSKIMPIRGFSKVH